MGASKYLPHYKSTSRKWVLVLHIYIYSNRSSMIVNMRGLDKYSSKHAGSQTNVQANTGVTYKQIRNGRSIYV